MNRRDFLRNGALMAAAASLSPAAWSSREPAFTQKSMEDALNRLFSTGRYGDSDAIHFKTPEIAENGAVVPVSVRYDGKAKRIALLVEENMQPLAALFNMTPKSVPQISTRIKMAKTSTVYAVVENADGRLLGVGNLVKVTIGGCGG